MLDPVVAADGHSYERAAIERWFALGHRTSPRTNEALRVQDLLPNHALRASIEDLAGRLGRLRMEQSEMQALLEEVLHGGGLLGREAGEAADAEDAAAGGAERGQDTTRQGAPEALRATWLRKRSRYVRQWRRRWVVLGRKSLRSFESAEAARHAAPTEDLPLHWVLGASTELRADMAIVRVALDGRSDVLLAADAPSEAKAWAQAIRLAAFAARSERSGRPGETLAHPAPSRLCCASRAHRESRRARSASPGSAQAAASAAAQGAGSAARS